MTSREVIARLLSTQYDLEKELQVRLVVRDSTHGNVISSKLVPVSYITNGCLCIEQNDLAKASPSDFG